MKTKKENIIIIELKQWEQAKLSNKSGIVKIRFQHKKSETAPPFIPGMVICLYTF